MRSRTNEDGERYAVEAAAEAEDGAQVVAERFQVLTPLYGGVLWYDPAGRWVKGSLEIRGERIEYVLDT